MNQHKSKWNANEITKFQQSRESLSHERQSINSFSREKKPSLDDQHESLNANCVNSLGLKFKGGSGDSKEHFKIVDMQCKICSWKAWHNEKK